MDLLDWLTADMGTCELVEYPYIFHAFARVGKKPHTWLIFPNITANFGEGTRAIERFAQVGGVGSARFENGRRIFSSNSCLRHISPYFIIIHNKNTMAFSKHEFELPEPSTTLTIPSSVAAGSAESTVSSRAAKYKPCECTGVLGLNQILDQSTDWSE